MHNLESSNVGAASREAKDGRGLQGGRRLGARRREMGAGALGALLVLPPLLASPPAQAQEFTGVPTCPKGTILSVLTVTPVPVVPDCTVELSLCDGEGYLDLSWLTSRVLDVPKFDPCDGQLQQVRLRFVADVKGDACVENLSTVSPCQTAGYTFNAVVEPQSSAENFPVLTGLSLGAISVPRQEDAGPLELFDGTPDCDGPSARDFGTWYELKDMSFSLGGADLDPWKMGVGPTIIRFEVTATGEYTAFGCSNLYFVGHSSLRVSLEVDYLYCKPDIVCPEIRVRVPEDGVVDIPVLSYFDLPNGVILDCTSLNVVDEPAHGSTELLGCTPVGCDVRTCFIRYRPDPNYCGDDSFTFTITAKDTTGCDVITLECLVEITVNPGNDPPIAVDDKFTVPENGSRVITPSDLLLNDYDPDLTEYGICGALIDPTCIVFVPLDPPPTCASVVYNPADCTVTVTPVAYQCFNDCPIFMYKIRDTEGRMSLPAMVQLNVPPMNTCPTAVDDKFRTLENVPITFTYTQLCQNDTDPDVNGCGMAPNCADPLIEILSTSNECGTVVVDPVAKTVTVTPTPYTCTEPGPPCLVLTYKISDGVCFSGPADVWLNVTGVNTCPTVVEKKFQTQENGLLTITFAELCEHATDPDTGGCGSPLDCRDVRISGIGNECASIQVNHGAQTIDVIPFPGVCTDPGAPCYLFNYEIGDGICYSEPKPVFLNIMPKNTCPTASDVKYYVQYPQSLTFDVSSLCAYATDPDANGCGAGLDCTSIRYTLLNPDCGTVVDDGTGRITFTPFTATCASCPILTWTIDDFDGCTSNTGTVRVNCECPTENRRKPASLLLYPEFDNREGVVSILTVTNTAGLGSSNLKVKFVYIDESNCQEFNRDAHMTPNDTLTLITSVHNPGQTRGYVYAYAACGTTNIPIAHNYLIGQLLIVDGLDAFSYAVNAVAFDSKVTQGSTCEGKFRTDLDGDGIRDLNDIEYAMAPDQILIPRFLGQNGIYDSELIFLNLTGGAAFTTTIGMLIYNDNEVVFSRDHTFFCWDKVPLLDISPVFGNDFLKTTGDDPTEILGMEQQESGWIRLNGIVAQSTATAFLDPAFYAVLIERTPEGRMVADLPFEYCAQDNGDLLPRSVNGDTSP